MNLLNLCNERLFTYIRITQVSGIYNHVFPFPGCFSDNLLSAGHTETTMAIVMIRTMIVFVSLAAFMRLLGKRQLGELELSELVVSVLVADLASLPLQDIGIPLLNGLVSIFTLFCLELILSGITLRWGRLRTLLFGRPCLLIEKGVIVQREMVRNRFTLDELTEELRRQGVTDIQSVEYAVLETDGTLNVLLFPAFRPLTAGDMGLDAGSRGYPHILISDGRVISGNLEKCGKTLDWLKKECRARGAASPSEVFILSLDEAGGIYYAGKEK